MYSTMNLPQKDVAYNKMIIIFDFQCDASLPSGSFDAGGGNKYSKNLIALLISKNMPFLYFTSKRFANLETEIQIMQDCFFFRIDIDLFNFDNIDYYINNIDKIINFIDSKLQKFEGYSFVFHSIYWTSGKIAEYFANQYKTYFIHTVISNGISKKMKCGNNENLELRCKIEKHIFMMAKYIICSSQYESDDIKNLYNIPSEKIILSGRLIEKEYIYPYQNIEGYPRTYQFTNNFPMHYISYDENQVFSNVSEEWCQMKSYIYVGRIHINKGIIQIIQAWESLYKKLGESTPPLWIVGGTPWEISAFKQRYLDKKCIITYAEKARKLVWWGTLTSEGISTLMAKSLVLVMHSKYEAGGNVLLEAMAHALPVIATPFGYARDYIRHSENGYLVEYGDIAALSKYMEYFSKQPYLSNYMGRVAANDMKALCFGEKFKNIHLWAYGLEDYCQPQKHLDNIIPRDSIDTFTQKLKIPDIQYIYYIVNENTDFKIVDINCKGNIDTYYLWEIITSIGTIYFYYLYSVLNRECLKKSNDNYFISRLQRVAFLQNECKKNFNKIYYTNASEGHILIKKREKVIL